MSESEHARASEMNVTGQQSMEPKPQATGSVVAESVLSSSSTPRRINSPSPRIRRSLGAFDDLDDNPFQTTYRSAFSPRGERNISSPRSKSTPRSPIIIRSPQSFQNSIGMWNALSHDLIIAPLPLKSKKIESSPSKSPQLVQSATPVREQEKQRSPKIAYPTTPLRFMEREGGTINLDADGTPKLDKRTIDLVNCALNHQEKVQLKRERREKEREANDDNFSDVSSTVSGDTAYMSALSEKQILYSQKRPDNVTEICVPHYNDSGKLILEVQDAPTQSNVATNLEIMEEKEQQEIEKKIMDKHFGEMQRKEFENYMILQRQALLERRSARGKEYNNYLAQREQMQINSKEQKVAEQLRIREKFAQLNNEERQKQNQLISKKNEVRDQYAKELEQQVAERTVISQEEKQVERIPQYDSPIGKKRELTPFEELKKRNEIMSVWDQQIEAKKQTQQQEKEQEKTKHNQFLMKTLQNLREDISKCKVERHQLREDMKNDWKRVLSESQEKEENGKESWYNQIQLRLEREKTLAEQRKAALLERTNAMRKRKEDLDQQVSYLATLRNKDRTLIDTSFMEQLKNEALRKKLYRCPKTRKLYPASEFNDLIRKQANDFK